MKKLLLSVLPAFFIALLLSNNALAATKSDAELDKIRKSGNDYTVDLTYEQAVKRAAELSGKSVDEIKKENPQPNSTKAATNASITSATTSATCGWVETLTTLSVSSTYKPKLSVILSACRDGSFGWVQTNVKPMYQGIVADSKKFDGDVQVDLESTGFYYVVNGRFYNNGTVTHTGTTGANTVWTATYSVSYSSDFYKSYYSGLKWRAVVN
ncbi:hypothetical protein [Anoxybacteroides tepidamans]|uniref:hypothetical protein n=1 Tax=Anoxybacteroides tepidamans TaxID=265948 RepID=UPI0004852560|nr:hypothetical protein [Anoxybacillus tepidamans]